MAEIVKLSRPLLRDSARYSETGRRLLVSIGAVTPDPLLVDAERWLLEHEDEDTPATRAVRAAIGPDVPAVWRELADRVRGVK